MTNTQQNPDIEGKVEAIKKELQSRFNPRNSGATNDFLGIVEEALTETYQAGVEAGREEAVSYLDSQIRGYIFGIQLSKAEYEDMLQEARGER